MDGSGVRKFNFPKFGICRHCGRSRMIDLSPEEEEFATEEWLNDQAELTCECEKATEMRRNREEFAEMWEDVEEAVENLIERKAIKTWERPRITAVLKAIAGGLDSEVIQKVVLKRDKWEIEITHSVTKYNVSYSVKKEDISYRER